MSYLLALSTLSISSLCAPAWGTQDWVVGPPGSGSDFHLVSMAIAAAAPNDSIYVLPGLYTEAEGLVIDKPLTVLGSGSLVTRVDIPTSTFASGCKPLEIRDSLATEVVQVGGFELSATELFGLGCPVRGVPSAARHHRSSGYPLDR